MCVEVEQISQRQKLMQKKKKRIKSKVWIDFRLVRAELTKKSKATVSPREQTRDNAIMTVIRARR